MNTKDQWVERYLGELEAVFDGYKGRVSGPVGVLVSGGIDSSIIARFAKKFFGDVRFFCAETEKGVDRPFVELLMEHLEARAEYVKVTREMMREAQLEVSELLVRSSVPVNGMQISLGSGFYFLARAAGELGVETIFTGQGPDILFAGYSKYRRQKVEAGIWNEGEEKYGRWLKEEIRRDLPLLDTDGKRDGAMGKRWGVTFLNPYLEKRFVEFALSVPAGFLIYEGVEKYISRKVGKVLKLPKEIVERPKKAFQYSSGIAKLNL